MKIPIQEFSLVIAGYWNPSIIIPEWINKFLRADSEQNIGIKLPVGNPTLPVIYEFDNVSLRVHAERIEFVPDDPNDPKIEDVIKFVRPLINELKHTPVQAVGINFVFQVEAPNNALLDIFETKDSNLITELPISLKGTQVIRKIYFNDTLDCELNFNAKLNENESVDLDFNFNKNISKLHEVDDFINRGILFYREKVQVILEIYSLNK